MLPTALLSTHSGGFEGFSFLDLTEEMERMLTHWKRIDLQFDAVQTGYLGSSKQIAVVTDALSLAKPNARIIVDPAMADNGKLYKNITEDMIGAMRTLCKRADIILPNLTEAALLADVPYQSSPSAEAVAVLSKRLSDQLGVQNIVLTGVSSSEGYGASCYDARAEEIAFFARPRVDDHFYGTGDTFASVLVASMENGKTLAEATEIATTFVSRTIEQSYRDGLERRYGTCFELQIPWLVRELGL